MPNWVFDELVPEKGVPASAIRVLLFMLRKTVGWDNRCEELSLTEIEYGAAVTRPTAIQAIRVICECWGLFHKSRGRKGQHSSVFTIADLSAEGFSERSGLLYDLYGKYFPNAKQLRDRPCTSDLLAGARRAVEEARQR